MSFWNELKSVNGRSSFGVQFVGNFANEVSAGGQLALMNIHTYRFLPDKNYQLTDIYVPGPCLIETQSVYVLAWKRDDISEVTFKELEGCNYFLTSVFSGCRFVVTEFGVSHISWSAGRKTQKWEGSQSLRDDAEIKSMSKRADFPKFRRRLSISGSSGFMDQFFSGANDAVSYDGQKENAMVFGHRENGKWKFKLLKYPFATGSIDGTWSIFI